MTRTLPNSTKMRPPPSATKNHPQPQLNPPSYYQTFHDQHHIYYSQPRPRPQFYQPPSSPVKFYRQTPSQINYKVASVLQSNGTSNSSNSSTSSTSPKVTMRRPPTASTRSTSSQRNAVYIKEVTPESAKAKPPLPSQNSSDQVPKPPPRSRPKSWTSTLFNAMRNNHRSVTFQCVDEEENLQNQFVVNSEAVIVASDPMPMPLAAASSSEGQKFYSLPRPPSQTILATRSRTPSPFRSMIKGLVKGEDFFL